MFPKTPGPGAQQIIHKRQKIADRCKDGWQVVESDELASNSVDINKLANAEKSEYLGVYSRHSLVYLGLR